MQVCLPSLLQFAVSSVIYIGHHRSQITADQGDFPHSFPVLFAFPSFKKTMESAKIQGEDLIGPSTVLPTDRILQKANRETESGTKK
jgi:hypothetical protein